MKWEIDFVTPIDNISWIQIHAALLFGDFGLDLWAHTTK